MNRSIEPETGSFDVSYIQAALRRDEAMRLTKVERLDPPTVAELEEALGQKIEKCELWKRNWRNQIYRLELSDGRAVVAKQLAIGTQARLHYQFNQLKTLGQLQIPNLRVPQPLALLDHKRVCVMEFAPGRTVEALLRNGSTGAQVLEACELAGKILAQLHTSWTRHIGPLPVEALARDFARAPWHLSVREREILQQALKALASAEVRMGQVYYDYKAANLLFDKGELYLVDPPDTLRRGVQLWDFALFRGSMRRQLWKFSVQRPFDRRRTVVRETLTAFARGYLATFGEAHPALALFPSAARVFELQRMAVLITVQQGKVDIAQHQAQTARDLRLGNRLATQMSLPLLKMEKAWLFRQLERELP